jgi:20S proteasome alpha/beta subunit
VEVTASVINELVNCYRGNVEEPFGYLLSGVENLRNGSARLYSVFGAGFSDIPSACLGSGSSYARPLVELLLAEGNLKVDEAARTLPAIFSLVSSVQTTVGDGVDIAIIRDDKGIDGIRYEKEVGLERLKAAIFGAFDLKL